MVFVVRLYVLLGSILMYHCMSHNISVSQSCGGGCRMLVSCGRFVVGVSVP